MICPYCAHEKTEVLKTAKSIINERFRRCKKCGKIFQTVEAIKFDNYWKEYAKVSNDIIKKDKND
jgi:transcriptional repressor NrdR